DVAVDPERQHMRHRLDRELLVSCETSSRRELVKVFRRVGTKPTSGGRGQCRVWRTAHASPLLHTIQGSPRCEPGSPVPAVPTKAGDRWKWFDSVIGHTRSATWHRVSKRTYPRRDSCTHLSGIKTRPGHISKYPRMSGYTQHTPGDTQKTRQRRRTRPHGPTTHPWSLHPAPGPAP